MNNLETESAQNRMASMIREIYLNIENPSVALKRQYYKATEAMRKARLELDLLNDMKKDAIGE